MNRFHDCQLMKIAYELPQTLRRLLCHVHL